MKTIFTNKFQIALLTIESSVLNIPSVDEAEILESRVLNLLESIKTKKAQLQELDTHKYVKAGDLKRILGQIPDDAKIKLGQEGSEYSAIDVKYDEELKSLLIQ